MEKKQVGGVFRLIIIMVFFIASIFFLHHQRGNSVVGTHIDVLNSAISPVVDLSLDSAYHHIHSLLTSRNIDLIAKVINQCMHQFTVELVEKIVKDATFLLSSEEKMKIMFATVAHCSKKKMQYSVLDLLLKYPELYTDYSVILTLLRGNYNNNFPLFISWAKERQKAEVRKGLLASFVDHALVTAIDQDDYDIVNMMFNKKVRVSYDTASRLLWHVVENNKNCFFISLFVKYAQADINSMRSGKTLLIEAVENNNAKMVQVLLDEGAVVDHVVDSEKGTALHIAMMNNDSTMEKLLREYGA